MKTHQFLTKVAIFLTSTMTLATAGKIIDHKHAVLKSIPLTAIQKAKDSLHIAYGHTSHGSQLLSGNGWGEEGINKIRGVKDVFNTSTSPAEGALHLNDQGMNGDAGVEGPSGRLQFVAETRTFLGSPNAKGRGSRNPSYNVVMWSWCGQVGFHSDEVFSHYLPGMDSLEKEYPNIQFVYMTGHLEGTGTQAVLHKRNEEIRAYARTHNKWLFDFADLESFDPDGNAYLAKMANDNADYDSNGDGTLDANWAERWTAAHPTEVNQQIEAAHSQPLVGQIKTTAAWWMYAELAGWNDAGTASVSPRRSVAPNFVNTASRDALGRMNHPLPAFLARP
ncbi:MAG: hypothetical protein IPO40_15815 [Fibrobacteres bacterium]|nr:hypothetical protein [Fibrobacterota bacterium]